MAKRLFKFRMTNGSGRYRVQVVDCISQAVITASGYTFDVSLTGQASEGLVEGFFDNIPAGTVIPAGSQLRVSDLSTPSAVKLGACSATPSIVCQPESTCAITGLTRTLGTVCAGGTKPLDYGFSVNETGDYAVSVVRFDTGVTVATKTHTATGTGVQDGQLPVLLTGMFPETPLYLRVVSAADPECDQADLTGLIRFPDTYQTLHRWTKGLACAALQRAACTGTHRVVAVSCATGDPLPVQPADWPVLFVSLSDAETYLTTQGWTKRTAPALVCNFGTIRKLALPHALTYSIAIDEVFSGEPTTFDLVNGDGSAPASPLGTLAVTFADETEPDGSVKRVRYLQLGLQSTTVGTVGMRLRASNAEGAANLLFSVVTLSTFTFALGQAAVAIGLGATGQIRVLTNSAVTSTFLSPQGECNTAPATTTQPLLATGGMDSPFTHQALIPVRPRGFYGLTIGSGVLSETLTVSLPTGGTTVYVDTRTALVPTPALTIGNHYESLPVTTPATDTVAFAQYRYVRGTGGVNDLLEVQMNDGYPESPMRWALWLATAATPIDGYLNFERRLRNGTVASDGLRRAFIETATAGSLAGKTLKFGITRNDNGSSANPTLMTLTIALGAGSTTGFVNLFPTQSQ